MSGASHSNNTSNAQHLLALSRMLVVKPDTYVKTTLAASVSVYMLMIIQSPPCSSAYTHASIRSYCCYMYS